MHKISIGSYRVTYIYDDYVIKYPLGKIGKAMNKEEYEKYLKNPDVFAKCELLENGDLKMELLDIQTNYVSDYFYFNDLYACELYDNDEHQTLHCNCDKHCETCKYAIKLNYDLEKLKPYIPQDRKIQVGYDKEGNLKFYDFAERVIIEKPFNMREEYKPLFDEWLATDRTQTFVDWVVVKELPQIDKEKHIKEIYKQANKIKRQMYIGIR